MDGQTDDGRTDRRMDGQTDDGRIGGLIDERTYGQMDRRMDKLTDKLTNRRIHDVFVIFLLYRSENSMFCDGFFLLTNMFGDMYYGTTYRLITYSNVTHSMCDVL
jgi:hypothetical protein